MLKGLFFFVHEGWKYDPRYILWNIFRQLVQAPLPIIAALMPRYMIDELIGERRAAYLLGYAAVLAGYTLVAAALSHYLGSDGFTRRCRVSAEFDSDLHRRLYTCDYANLESSRFLDMQERAKKFLYCNWHGFGYLLDCALNILGRAAALFGIITLIATLSTGLILVPWALVCFLQTDSLRAVGLLVIFAAATLTRSIMEPKLVGKQLGLDPLVTLIALYLGYRIWGLPGMILSPLLAVAVTEAVSRS